MVRKFFITNSLQLKPNKIAEFYKKNYCDNQQDFREVHQQDLLKMKELSKIPKFYLRWVHQTEVHRGSEDYYGIIWKTSRTTEWSKLYEWFQGFYGCWIDLQWKFTRYQFHLDYSLNILHLKDYWSLPSYRSDKLMGRQIFGIHQVYQETFFAHPQTSSSAPYPQELNSTWRKTIEEPIHMSTAEKSGRPERDPDLTMPVQTVSQRFSDLQWRRLFKELWGRPTTIADFGSSFWQVPYASNLCLLEDKIQNRGMYLFTISYGSNAMDQGSGVGWFSGWIEIFVI